MASGKTPHVRFDLNDYSTPHTLVRRPLTLVASERAARLLGGTQEIARYARCWDKGQIVEKPEHFAGRGPNAAPTRCAGATCCAPFADTPYAHGRFGNAHRGDSA